MERLVIAAGVVLVAVVVAVWFERRRPDAPTQAAARGVRATQTWPVPTQLDRADFAGADTPWLVAVFTSATCNSCAQALDKARVLASDEVWVEEVEVKARGDLHRRYHVEAVPTLVVADAEGVVRASFVGPPSATDLWAAVAEARAPGSSPEPELGRG